MTSLISQPTLLPLKQHMLHPQNHYLSLLFPFLLDWILYATLKKKKIFRSRLLSPVVVPGRSAGAKSGTMEFAVGKPADDSGTRPCVNFRGTCHPFISRWRCARAGRRSRQPSLDHSCVWRGNEWLQQQEHGPGFPAGAPGAASVGHLRRWVTSGTALGRALVLLTAGSRMRLSSKGMVSANCVVSSPSSVRRVGVEQGVPWQQGRVGRMGLIYFVVVLHSSTKQPGLLPVLHQSASASVGPEGLHWTALQWGLWHPCHHVSYLLNFCWFF